MTVLSSLPFHMNSCSSVSVVQRSVLAFSKKLHQACSTFGGTLPSLYETFRSVSMLCLPICLNALQFISTTFYSFRIKVLLFSFPSFLFPSLSPFHPSSFLSSFFPVFLILDKSFAAELPPPHSSVCLPF